MLNKKIEIYQVGDDDHNDIQVRIEQETVWLSQAQMAELFTVKPQSITMHLKRIFLDGELEEKATCKYFLQVQQEGVRAIERRRKLYNLDAVISVGYRVNSKRAVLFRRWATKLLREHLTQGFTLNQQRLEQNSAELEQALLLVRKASRSPALTSDAGRGLVDIVTRYAQTFLLLQRYDEGLLEEPQGEKGGILPSAEEAMLALLELRQQLMARNEATSLFANPRDAGLASIFGNLEQTIFGEPAYPTIETKAAHLLYFVVKNHPFSDGNKRSGAFLFVDFLHRNQRLMNAKHEPIINDTGLAALTLLVAESSPKNKEIMIRLIINMIKL